uniref:Uncharacterized protein n=1 Tax=Janibacter limosus TaxID=53458 RepID=A0AC61U4A0_9MICO|nr:hypothetical protein [Janibacter limosus]
MPVSRTSPGRGDLDVDRAGVLGRAEGELAHQQLDGAADLLEGRLAEAGGWQLTAQQLGAVDRARVVSGDAGPQGAVADGPFLQAVEVDGQPVADLLGLAGDTHLQPVAQEPASGVVEEQDQVSE